MSRLETWMKRFRTMGGYKTQERVFANDKYEIMTSTQACRFEQLQRIRFTESGNPGDDQRVMPYYPLAEASRRLATSIERLLRMAGAGDFACYVSAAGLRGDWQLSGGSGASADMPGGKSPRATHLALRPADCRDIEAYGSANVSVLEFSLPGDRRVQLTLHEPLWVDPERILLKHPLPAVAAA